MKKLIKIFKNFYNYRFLLSQLIVKNIKLKYRKSYLGILWSLIEPILTMLVLTLVFGTLLGRGDQYYPIYIISGRLLYSFFSTGTKQAMRSIRSNSAMIKKVYVPKYFYPLSSCISSYIISLISLIDLFLVALVMGLKLTPYIFLSILPIAILLLLTYGVSMILSTINVFFRDIEYIWDVFSMLIMYTSAIFYKADSLVGTVTYDILHINPLFCLIDCFRSCIFGSPMDIGSLLYAFGFSIVLCIFGTWVTNKNQDRFIFHI